MDAIVLAYNRYNGISKPTNDFPILVNRKICSTWHRLALNHGLPFWNISMDVESNVNISYFNATPTPDRTVLFDFYAHQITILHRLITKHNAADR